MCVLEVKSSRVEADAVDRRCDREDVRSRQAGRAPEALVAVARRRVDDLDRPAAGCDAHRSARRGRAAAPCSTSTAFSAQTSTIVPATPAGIEFIIFMTSIRQTIVSGSTRAPDDRRTALRPARRRGRRCRASATSIVTDAAAAPSGGADRGRRRRRLRAADLRGRRRARSPPSRSAARRASDSSISRRISRTSSSVSGIGSALLSPGRPRRCSSRGRSPSRRALGALARQRRHGPRLEHVQRRAAAGPARSPTRCPGGSRSAARRAVRPRRARRAARRPGRARRGAAPAPRLAPSRVRRHRARTRSCFRLTVRRTTSPVTLLTR